MALRTSTLESRTLWKKMLIIAVIVVGVAARLIYIRISSNLQSEDHAGVTEPINQIVMNAADNFEKIELLNYTSETDDDEALRYSIIGSTKLYKYAIYCDKQKFTENPKSIMDFIDANIISKADEYSITHKNSFSAVVGLDILLCDSNSVQYPSDSSDKIKISFGVGWEHDHNGSHARILASIHSKYFVSDSDCLDSFGSRLYYLTIEDYPIDSTFNLHEKFPSLIALHGATIDADEDIEMLSRLTGLSDLTININQVVDFTALAKADVLKTLTLNLYKDIDYASLASVRSLQVLKINEYAKTKFTNLEQLNQVKQILYYNCRPTNVL